jgi:hypothetical protein
MTGLTKCSQASLVNIQFSALISGHRELDCGTRLNAGAQHIFHIERHAGTSIEFRPQVGRPGCRTRASGPSSPQFSRQASREESEPNNGHQGTSAHHGPPERGEASKDAQTENGPRFKNLKI